MSAETGGSEGGLAAERRLAQRNQDMLNEMQARSERLRATMVALVAQSKDLLRTGPEALATLPSLDRKPRRRPL